jgi:hypothetical protein
MPRNLRRHAADGPEMSASRTSLAIDSRPSGPTLDLHTDAIILREGPAVVASTVPLRGSSPPSVTSMATATATPTLTSLSTATPTEPAPSPFFVRRTVFRAAPGILTVGPGPATVRAEARVRARLDADASMRSSDARRKSADLARAPAPASWAFLAVFALGAATSALMPMTTDDRGIELAIMAAVIASVQTLAVAMSGKARAGTADD